MRLTLGGFSAHISAFVFSATATVLLASCTLERAPLREIHVRFVANSGESSKTQTHSQKLNSPTGLNAKPVALSEFDCIGIHISGLGIPSKTPPAKFCESAPVKVFSIARSFPLKKDNDGKLKTAPIEATFFVPQGPDRIIEVWAIKTDDGKCPAPDEKKPESNGETGQTSGGSQTQNVQGVYEIGLHKLDVFKDVSPEISVKYTEDSPQIFCETEGTQAPAFFYNLLTANAGGEPMSQFTVRRGTSMTAQSQGKIQNGDFTLVPPKDAPTNWTAPVFVEKLADGSLKLTPAADLILPTDGSALKAELGVKASFPAQNDLPARVETLYLEVSVVDVPKRLDNAEVSGPSAEVDKSWELTLAFEKRGSTPKTCVIKDISPAANYKWMSVGNPVQDGNQANKYQCKVSGKPTAAETVGSFKVSVKSEAGESEAVTVTLPAIAGAASGNGGGGEDGGGGNGFSVKYARGIYTLAKGLIFVLLPTQNPAQDTHCVLMMQDSETPMSAPEGIAFDNDKCQFSGSLSSAVAEGSVHKLRVRATLGQQTSEFKLTLNIRARVDATLSYPQTVFLDSDTGSATPTITFTGDSTDLQVKGCQLATGSTQTLPAGLSIENAGCKIQGKPTELKSGVRYSIIAGLFTQEGDIVGTVSGAAELSTQPAKPSDLSLAVVTVTENGNERKKIKISVKDNSPLATQLLAEKFDHATSLWVIAKSHNLPTAAENKLANFEFNEDPFSEPSMRYQIRVRALGGGALPNSESTQAERIRIPRAASPKVLNRDGNGCFATPCLVWKGSPISSGFFDENNWTPFPPDSFYKSPGGNTHISIPAGKSVALDVNSKDTSGFVGFSSLSLGEGARMIVRRVATPSKPKATLRIGASTATGQIYVAAGATLAIENDVILEAYHDVTVEDQDNGPTGIRGAGKLLMGGSSPYHPYFVRQLRGNLPAQLEIDDYVELAGNTYLQRYPLSMFSGQTLTPEYQLTGHDYLDLNGFSLFVPSGIRLAGAITSIDETSKLFVTGPYLQDQESTQVVFEKDYNSPNLAWHQGEAHIRSQSFYVTSSQEFNSEASHRTTFYSKTQQISLQDLSATHPPQRFGTLEIAPRGGVNLPVYCSGGTNGEYDCHNIPYLTLIGSDQGGNNYTHSDSAGTLEAKVFCEAGKGTFNETSGVCAGPLSGAKQQCGALNWMAEGGGAGDDWAGFCNQAP